MKPDPAHSETDKAIERLEKKIFDSYNEATADMIRKQEQFLRAYEQELEEMKDCLERKTISKGQFDAWKKEQAFNKQWYDQMINSIAYDALEADKRAAAIINGELPKTYAINYNYGTYQIEHGTTIKTAFTLHDENTVALLLKEDPRLFQHAAVNELKDLAWNRQKISSALLQGVLQGESIDNIASRLMSVFEMDYNSAVRTARTCMTGAQNAGRLDSYERAQRMGIMGKKRWVCTMDDRTRETHLQLDGEAVDINESFSNGLEYPGDESTGDPAEYMNCRCTMIYEFDGTNYDNADRDDRLAEMDFDSWLDEHYGF